VQSATVGLLVKVHHNRFREVRWMPQRYNRQRGRRNKPSAGRSNVHNFTLISCFAVEKNVTGHRKKERKRGRKRREGKEGSAVSLLNKYTVYGG